MFTKSLLLGASIAALVIADPIPQAAPTTSFNPAALTSELASLTASLAMPSGGLVPGLPSIYSDFPTLPASVESVLATAIPASFIATETDPCALLTDAPQWYASLPASIKSAITSYDSAVVSWEKEHSAALASLTSVATSGQASYTAASVPALVCTNTAAAVAGKTTAAGSTATGTAVGSSSSKAAAPRATGAVAVGLAGAVGVLGLMAAL
ncbi:hypothetical protein L207DRAFT_528917 [Hyaloscypha variabilis F]|uniref:Infection structure specific protein n=1 Tax=Hyaloscypha variabilis (strain UAMH 11265 / GT02V1 / F) TaxID=1149755 RepID=A0A2J6RQ14_HYAVF|nr:hypothetical protein L207DRAFT_528917 [Hyaloscypha variabilis F]